MKKIQDMDFNEKTVLVRLDLNVSLNNGKIIDDTKIKESLPTINYLLTKKCKIIIFSHFGKVKSEEDKIINSLLPVKNRLEELLNKEVLFSNYTRGIELNKIVNSMNYNDILLVENTRFEDIPNKLESNNDIQLSMEWANLGDVYVNDAFGSCHRSHASVTGIAKYLPSCAGFLLQKEIEMLSPLINNPKRPFAIVMGGTKIEDKILLIKKLLNECDYLLLGGGIANTFLKALNLDIGSSIVNDSVIDEVKELLIKYKNKIILPLDVIVGNGFDDSYVDYKLINQINSNDIIFDIGTKTIEKFKEALNISNTIFVNGTMGKYEEEKYRNGTLSLLQYLNNCGKNVVLGGGDAVSSAKTLGCSDKISYLSTGGGATLEYLSEKKLPGIEALKD